MTTNYLFKKCNSFQETRNAEDGKIFHYPLSVPISDNGETVVGVFGGEQNPSREMLPSFGRLLVRDGGDSDNMTAENLAKAYYARDSGQLLNTASNNKKCFCFVLNVGPPQDHVLFGHHLWSIF